MNWAATCGTMAFPAPLRIGLRADRPIPSICHIVSFRGPRSVLDNQAAFKFAKTFWREACRYCLN
jgi:hypothetical protein